ncbi:uncharacterized protein LOC110250887 isoform X2 [Exaiptasia diaphana]|uniref:Uncharacterized protein n=1 Tax=Exaiptasia diaphana TaxID=2652724 RepID=A0A913Y0I8_EXADI|nr:uncharacterized protein LOC110250887 isoform X2 [Exaiptasia diaphana]
MSKRQLKRGRSMGQQESSDDTEVNKKRQKHTSRIKDTQPESRASSSASTSAGSSIDDGEWFQELRKIPNDEIDEMRAMSFFEKGKEKVKEKQLKEHVKRCWRRDPKIKKDLKNVTFVEGPWVQVEEKSVRIIGGYQICLLSEEMAKSFSRHLHAVIFFHNEECCARQPSK